MLSVHYPCIVVDVVVVVVVVDVIVVDVVVVVVVVEVVEKVGEGVVVKREVVY